MNYEEKYRRALEKAIDLLDHHEVRREDMEYLFPEIGEGEDECIRQRIIHALHGDVLDMEETNKAIAWLEKQKPTNNERCDTNDDFSPLIDAEIGLWINENENIHHNDKNIVGLMRDMAYYVAGLTKNLYKQKPSTEQPVFLSPDRAGDSIKLSDLPKLKQPWKRIPKDKDGLYDEEASTMYDELPIIIIQEINDNGESDYNLCYIDERTWFDWEHDLNKPTFNWYMPCEKLPIEL